MSPSATKQTEASAALMPSGLRLGNPTPKRMASNLDVIVLTHIFSHPFGLGCEDWANPWNVQAKELGSSSAKDLYLIGKFVKWK